MKKLAFLVVFALSALVQARHLEGRTGFGVTVHPFAGVPSVSMHHHMSDYQSALVLAGVDTSDSSKTIIAGGKFYQNAHLEENLNFYVGLGGFIISTTKGLPASSTGFEVDGIFGAEVFLAGLPNLGIQFETGIGIRTVPTVSFSTLGSGFLGGAVHYYF